MSLASLLSHGSFSFALAPQVLRIGHVRRAHRLEPMAGVDFGELPTIIELLTGYETLGLERGRPLRPYSIMHTVAIEIRRAKSSDAEPLAATHDLAWRTAYQGIIPGPELDKLINRRGAEWWEGAIRKGSRISILAFGDTIAGYANYGRNRARSLAYEGEIYELYLRPEFQGLGFGRRLFAAARRDLTQSEIKSMVVWALSDNTPAVAFYRALGGRPVARSCEKFGDKTLDKIAYAWSA